MDNLLIEGSKFEPTIDFNAETGCLNVSGTCYIKFPDVFFESVFVWLCVFLHISDSDKKIVCNFKLTHFNTASGNRFLDLLKMLAYHKYDKNANVVVNWHHRNGDVDMKEKGMIYAADVRLEFVMIEY